MSKISGPQPARDFFLASWFCFLPVSATKALQGLELSCWKRLTLILYHSTALWWAGRMGFSFRRFLNSELFSLELNPSRHHQSQQEWISAEHNAILFCTTCFLNREFLVIYGNNQQMKHFADTPKFPYQWYNLVLVAFKLSTWIHRHPSCNGYKMMKT